MLLLLCEMLPSYHRSLHFLSVLLVAATTTVAEHHRIDNEMMASRYVDIHDDVIQDVLKMYTPMASAEHQASLDDIAIERTLAKLRSKRYGP